MDESLISADTVLNWLTKKDARLLARIGVELVSFDGGVLTMQMRVTADMLNSSGYCQGGILFTLADQAGAYVALASNRKGTTLSADINYTNPASLDDILTATAIITVDKNRIATCDVDIHNQDKLPIAQFRAVWYRTKGPVVS